MAATYDLTTNIGQVRLLIADTDTVTPDFQDEELTALLTLEGGSLKRAAARALETLAASRARLAVRKTRGEVTDDLTQIAKELRATAAQLREEAASSDDGGALGVIITPSYEAFSTSENDYWGREDAIQ